MTSDDVFKDEVMKYFAEKNSYEDLTFYVCYGDSTNYSYDVYIKDQASYLLCIIIEKHDKTEKLTLKYQLNTSMWEMSTKVIGMSEDIKNKLDFITILDNNDIKKIDNLIKYEIDKIFEKRKLNWGVRLTTDNIENEQTRQIESIKKQREEVTFKKIVKDCKIDYYSRRPSYMGGTNWWNVGRRLSLKRNKDERVDIYNMNSVGKEWFEIRYFRTGEGDKKKITYSGGIDNLNDLNEIVTKLKQNNFIEETKEN
jgi:hypothetical protein